MTTFDPPVTVDEEDWWESTRHMVEEPPYDPANWVPLPPGHDDPNRNADTIAASAVVVPFDRAKKQTQPAPDGRGAVYGRLAVFGMDDLDTAPSRDYYVKGLISPNEISVWCGAPKCGKSFLLLDIAYRLSLGLSVFGRRVKPANVLYVAAEGEGGIGKRIKALRDKYGPSPAFKWIAQPADLLHRDGHLGDLVEAVRTNNSQIVVLDTLSRMLSGGDENAPGDMGKFIANITELRAATGAHIAIVHHGSKASNGTSPRGHSSLTGADDALIEVNKHEDGTRSAYVVHAKDDADGDRFGFTLDPVELGQDEDGDPITTLTVSELDQPAAQVSATKLKGTKAIAVRCLKKALAESGFMSVVGHGPERLVCYLKDWRKVFYQEGAPDKTGDAKRMAFSRTMTDLLSREVAALDDMVWLTEG